MKLANTNNSLAYNLQLTLGYNENDRGSYGLVMDLDTSLIGTRNYMGLAYFWDHDVKHTMREMTPKFRKVVHDTAMKNNLIKAGFVKTNNEFIKIINATLKKFKIKDSSSKTGWGYFFEELNE